jgi:hypothetical protein
VIGEGMPYSMLGGVQSLLSMSSKDGSKWVGRVSHYGPSIRILRTSSGLRDGNIRVVDEPRPEFIQMLRVRSLRFGIRDCTRRFQ